MAADMFKGPSAEDVSFLDLLACVDRELGLRAKVYPRWVKDGKLSEKTAEREMLLMRGVRSRVIRAQAIIEVVIRYANTWDHVDEFHAAVNDTESMLRTRHPEAS